MRIKEANTRDALRDAEGCKKAKSNCPDILEIAWFLWYFSGSHSSTIPWWLLPLWPPTGWSVSTTPISDFRITHQSTHSPKYNGEFATLPLRLPSAKSHWYTMTWQCFVWCTIIGFHWGLLFWGGLPSLVEKETRPFALNIKFCNYTYWPGDANNNTFPYSFKP